MLNKILFLMLGMTAFVSTGWSAAFNADPKHSSIVFNISHGMAYTVGSFDKFSASVETDGDKILSARAVLEVASINTRSPARDKGLCSPLFFDAAKFPQATFESSKVEGDQMAGTLTIKGISKPVTLTVTLKDGVFQAKGSLNRKDFGINYDRELLHHEKAIGDMVDLTVEFKK